jgi:hypothetical protein
MTAKVLTKTIDRPVSEVAQNLSNIFEKNNVRSPVEPERISSLANYQWFSDANKREAGENLACTMVAAEGNMPAQVEARFNRALMAYDTDRVEKATFKTKDIYPGAKVFGTRESTDAPIIFEGKDHIWAGQLLSEMYYLERKDQLIPKKVMKRVNLFLNNGLAFEDGYALFWPHQAYKISKRQILANQFQSLKNDTRRLASGIKKAVNTGMNMTTSFAGAVGEFAGSVTMPRFNSHLTDPVLTGVIAGSLREKRYFFIEIGRWINSD